MRRQLITHPDLQGSFTLAIVGGLVIMFGLIGGISILTLYMLSLDPAVSVEQSAIILQTAQRMGVSLLYATVTLLLGGVAIGLYLSYKYVGPLTRIEDWCRNSLSGDFGTPLKLRPGDDLGKIARLLNKVVYEYKKQVETNG